MVDNPAYDDTKDTWVAVASRTKANLRGAKTRNGSHYKLVEVIQPKNPRGRSDEFLATYMNYYVCNGAVIAPQFGDPPANAAARNVLAALFPGREIVMVNIDPIAAGGGGIHCATQQQPQSGRRDG